MTTKFCEGCPDRCDGDLCKRQGKPCAAVHGCSRRAGVFKPPFTPRGMAALKQAKADGRHKEP